MKTNTADKWFSRFIRLRDSDENGIGKCCTCGRIGEVKYMDNGHYIKRQHSRLRYSEINCNLQCKKCNAFEQGRDVNFRKYLVEKYGENSVLILEKSKYGYSKKGKMEIRIIADYYKEQVNKILKNKNIKKWW